VSVASATSRSDANRYRVSELTKRVITALILAPLAIAAAWFGDAALAALLSGAAGAGAWELCRLARQRNVEPLDAVAIGASAAVPLLFHAMRLGLAQPNLGWLAIYVIGVLGAVTFRRSLDRSPLSAAAITILAPLYVGMTLSFAYLLRYHSYAVGQRAQVALVVLPVLLTWACDIGAYFTGRAVGRTKLAPSVSPSKTVEGSLGGLLASVLLCWFFVRTVLVPHGQLGLTPLGIIVFAVTVAIAAQVGDLAESLLKREAGVKDSSSLLPGHGGVLDRLDSLFFVLPVAWMLSYVLLVPAPQG
jgi:phosphatidate cytidylyltransferase